MDTFYLLYIFFSFHFLPPPHTPPVPPNGWDRWDENSPCSAVKVFEKCFWLEQNNKPDDRKGRAECLGLGDCKHDKQMIDWDAPAWDIEIKEGDGKV